MQSIMTENKLLVDWGWWRSQRDVLQKGKRKLLWRKRYVLFPACMVSWVYTYAQLSDLIHKCVQFIYLFSVFLALHQQHVEVPRLGVGIGTITAGLSHSHSNIRCEPQGARPGIEPASSWILVRFITAEPRQELLCNLFYVYYTSMQP